MVTFPPQNNLAHWQSLLGAVRDPDEKSWILLNPTSLGDTWTVCALARAFRETHGGKITMVVPQRQVEIAQLYEGDIGRIISVDPMALHNMCVKTQNLSRFELDTPIIAHPFWYGDGRLGELANLYRYPGRGGISFSDQFRYILHLDWDAPLAKPTVPAIWQEEARVYADQVGIVPGKSVILFPDNNTNEPLPLEFWEPLVQHLNASGHVVFTNMYGNAAGPRTEPVKGSLPITVPLRLAIPLVERAGRFISTANGMAAMLVGCDVDANYSWITIKRGSVEAIHGQLSFISQSIRYSGFLHKSINEYRVDPDADMSEVVADIAADSPRSAIPPGVYIP